MRNVIICVLCGLSVTGMLYSYDPPAGSDRLFLYGHPRFITSANSAAGGPLFSDGSFSITMNPALSAGLQSLSADAGYTALPQIDGLDAHYSQALHLGLSIPTRYGVLTGGIHALFAKSGELPYGDLAVFRLGWARDVTENLYLGLSAAGGLLYYDDTSDFYLAGDFGIWYRLGKLAFLKNTRIGLAVQNLGKTFSTAGPVKYDNVTGFPGGIISPKIGVAASLVEVNKFSWGVSADLSLMSVIHPVLDAGIQIAIADFFYLSAGWDLNLREAVSSAYSQTVHSPYIGLGVKFSVNTSGSELMKKRGFNETTLETEAVWQKLHQDTQLFSAGVSARFGVKDLIPPDISVGEIRYNE